MPSALQNDFKVVRIRTRCRTNFRPCFFPARYKISMSTESSSSITNSDHHSVWTEKTPPCAPRHLETWFKVVRIRRIRSHQMMSTELHSVATLAIAFRDITPRRFAYISVWHLQHSNWNSETWATKFYRNVVGRGN
ncbi:hypothetical protein niasHS_000873 [Heterodera schachtii]|uniref:Uncharacterized protein n=1 Tax=Heterodera schachtii TaxID=97005 RepID=A0ABD2KM79_HETSC